MTTDPRDYANLLRRLKMRASHFDCKEAADTIEDLRQRLEAVKSAASGLKEASESLAEQLEEAEASLTEARAGQAAAWTAGRDAAADMPFPEGWRDLGGGMNLKQQGYWAAGFNSCRNMIDALDPPTDLSTALTKHDQRVRDAAATLVEQAPGSIADRQELAARIRALKKGG